MAFTADDYQVTASGTLAGGEVWYNSWGAIRTDGAATVADLIAQFQAFYADVFALHICNETTLNNISAKNLFTELVTESPVNPVGTGSDSSTAPMPNQLAIRVSLKSNPNVNGGPFLAGWSTAAASADGDLLAADHSGLVTAVEDLRDNLVANDWQLAIMSPTASTAYSVDQARIGQRYDIIRKRANERLEDYSTIAF